MISDSNLLHYACVAHQSDGIGGDSATILAEYNSGDSSLPELAQECLIRTPLNHSLFSHTVHRCSYTFLIDDPFVYFAISDSSLPKSDRIWLLSQLKDAAQHLIAKHGKSILCRNRSFNSYCFQSQIHPILHQLVTDRGAGADTAVDSDGRLPGIPCKVQSRGRRNFAVPLLVKMEEGLKKKKKRLFGESGGESREVLVDDKVELSDQCEAPGADATAGGKQKAKKIWRKHVWVVLVLDLTLCLILFGIWLMVCHGFQCID